MKKIGKLDQRLLKIANNSGWLFVDRILRMIGSMLVGTWMARYMGVAQFGIYNFALSVTAISLPIVMLGLESIVIRDLLRSPDSHNKLIGTSFFTLLISSASGILLSLITLYLINFDIILREQLILIISLGFMFKSLNCTDYYFQSELLSKKTAIARMLAWFVSSALKVTFILTKAPLIYFAWTVTAEAMIEGLTMLVLYQKSGKKVQSWVFDKSLAKSLIKTSLPLAFSGILVIINLHADRVMITELSNDFENGLYSAASSISQISYFIPVFFGASIVPDLINSYTNHGLDLYRKKLVKAFKLMNIASIAIITGTIFLGDFVIDLLFGAKFDGSAELLKIHVLSSIFVFHVSLRTRALIIENKQSLVGKMSLWITFTNIAFNFWAIPKFGSIGASYASLASWAAGVLIIPLGFKYARTYVIEFFQSLNIFTFKLDINKE